MYASSTDSAQKRCAAMPAGQPFILADGNGGHQSGYDPSALLRIAAWKQIIP
jgi:hypothetical protein